MDVGSAVKTVIPGVERTQLLLAKKPTSHERNWVVGGIYFPGSAASAGAHLSPRFSKISATA